MPTDVVVTPDMLVVTNDGEDHTLYMSSNNGKSMFITNTNTDEADARNFYFTIFKEDWEGIKSFFDKQFNK